MKQKHFEFRIGRSELFLVGCGALALLCGCGRSGDLVEVAGSVTFNGQLLDKGQIMFVPVQDYETGFSSFHPGGAHFMNADGSVRFLGETMDQSVLAARATRNYGDVASVTP